VAASAFGFLTLNQLFDGPARNGASGFFETIVLNPRRVLTSHVDLTPGKTSKAYFEAIFNWRRMRDLAMKVTRITMVVLWALTILLLAPLEAKAGAHGFGMQSSHFRGQHFVRGQHFALAQHHFRFFRHLHHQAFGLWPWYGYYNVPPYTYDDSMTYPTPEPVVVRPEPPPCQHSEQKVKVPSENGGTREVTIFRC